MRVVEHVQPPSRGFSMPLDRSALNRADRILTINGAKSPNGAVLRYLHEVNLRMPLIHAACTMAADSGVSQLEGMLLALTAGSFTGKSYCMAQIEADERFQPRLVDGQPVTPMVVINAPSPCTLLTLGTQLLDKLGWIGTYPDRLHKVWYHVRKLLIARGVMVIMINEFHNLIVARTPNEVRQLAQALKGVLVGDVIVRAPSSSSDAKIVNNPPSRFPVFVFAGGTDLMRAITDNVSDPLILEVARRSVTLSFSEIPIDRASNGLIRYRGMEKFLTTLEREMGFPPDPRLTEAPIHARHYKAGNRYFGRVACIIKNAALLSVMNGSKMPPFDYLPAAFADLYKLPAKKNPYLVADIDSVDFPPLPDELERRADSKGHVHVA